MTEHSEIAFAAKAAGLQITVLDGECVVVDEGGYPMYVWSPLTSDAQAFRLAVRLDMQILVNRVDEVSEVIAGYHTRDLVTITEHHGEDMYAATRLAIFKAAVEAGKKLP